MKLSQQSLSIIESAIQKAVAKYVCSCEQTVVTDIHLQPDQASGQLNIYMQQAKSQSTRLARTICLYF